MIRNDGNDAVTLNTGYLQHGVSYNEDKKTGQFYLLTDNQSSSGYKLVPSIDEMKLVTLKGLQYCKIAYKFRPDDEDKEMLELIKRGIRIRVTYSSKDRGFAYAYWKGRISSLNFISLESE